MFLCSIRAEQHRLLKIHVSLRETPGWTKPPLLLHNGPCRALPCSICDKELKVEATAKLRAAGYTSLYLLCCRLSSGTGSLSERSWWVQSSHPSTPRNLRGDLELQNDCAYGVKQRPWISSRQELARALHVCVDFWLLLAQCKA